jgi:hypothetical protein
VLDALRGPLADLQFLFGKRDDLLAVEREPAMVNVSRQAQIVLTQVLPRPEKHTLPPARKSTPSSRTLQVEGSAAAHIGDRSCVL